MKRKQYEKPQMKVVVMNQRAQLLAGSLTGNRNDAYGNPTTY